MRTLLAGVIGHVDHGKTALVKALTGIDTDRLREERERGLSIVLGFSHLAAAEDGEIDLIDMPGHERFVRTMISGATGIDAALLAVDATEGIKPQTLEHVEIARLIGVRQGVIAITKCDAAPAEQAARVAADAGALAATNGLPARPHVFTSALRGDGIGELAERLAGLLDGQAARVDHGFFHLPIDRVFSAPGFGTVVTGTLRRGAIAVGDRVEIVPGGLCARVRGLQVHNRPVASAEPGRRVAVNLRDVDRTQLGRGQALCTPGALAPVQRLDADLRLLESAPRPLRHQQLVRLLFGTSEVSARVRLLDRDLLDPGATALVQLQCAQEIAVPAREPFIIRLPSPARTIGGGRIIAPAERRRRRHDPAVTGYLRALNRDDPALVIAARLRGAGHRGCALAELGRLVGFAPSRLGTWLDRAQARRFHDDTVLHRAICSGLEEILLVRLDDFHRRHAGEPGIGKEQLRRYLPEALPAVAFDDILSALAARGRIVREQGLIRQSGFRPARPAGEAPAAPLTLGIEQEFRRGGLAPADVGAVIGSDPRRMRILRDLVQSGRLVATFDRVQKRQVIFHREAVQHARRVIEAQFAGVGGFLVGDVGQALGMSRKYSIPLLEYLDSLHCTRRIGDRRVVIRGVGTDRSRPGDTNPVEDEPFRARPIRRRQGSGGPPGLQNQ